MDKVADDHGLLEETPGQTLERVAAHFGLLASPVRLRLLRILAQGESGVAHLAEEAGGALSTISQHLSALKRAGLVGARRDGRRHVYYIDDPAVIAVVQIMVGRVEARLCGGR